MRERGRERKKINKKNEGGWKKLQVRAIHKDGLLWGASKLVPIGYGIKKMQITAVIEDAKVESMDAIIEGNEREFFGFCFFFFSSYSPSQRKKNSPLFFLLSLSSLSN